MCTLLLMQTIMSKNTAKDCLIMKNQQDYNSTKDGVNQFNSELNQNKMGLKWLLYIKINFFAMIQLLIVT